MNSDDLSDKTISEHGDMDKGDDKHMDTLSEISTVESSAKNKDEELKGHNESDRQDYNNEIEKTNINKDADKNEQNDLNTAAL